MSLKAVGSHIMQDLEENYKEFSFYSEKRGAMDYFDTNYLASHGTGISLAALLALNYRET